MAPNPEWYLEKKFRQGLLLLLIVIAINAGVSVRALRNMRTDENRVGNTQAVLTQIETTLSTLEAAETGQRGYLYTGRSEYLRPYLFATQEVNGQLDKLAQMTADNPSERERVAALRPLVAAKMQEMAQTIALHDNGNDQAARAVVLSEFGREQMGSIRQLLTEMRDGEQRTLVQRTLKSQETAHSGAISLIIASSLAVALIALLIYVITRDLRRVAKAQAEISERQAWLQTTLRSIGDAVIATDTDGNIKFLNGVAEKLTGWKSEEAAGQPICDVFAIFNEETGEPCEQPVRRVLQSGAVCGLANHTVLRNRAGHDMPINDSAAPIVDDQGNVSGVVLVFRDDTQRRKSEAALVRAEKFAATGRMAATLAHEINNPLEAAMNLVYLARRAPGLSPEFQGYLQAAQSQLEFAAHASRRTLTIYRSDVTPGAASLEQILEDVASLYDSRLRSRGIELVRKYSFNDNIVMNAADMRQAFSNVISNAVDACGPGDTITLRTSRVEENGNHQAVVTIEDTGPGVPKQDRGRLFEPFFTTKPAVGTGLGLWVTRQIVEKNGGRIELRTDTESENHGTHVSIMLPIKKQVIAKAAD
jgi:PAS domain S-box-containing protein